jgi:hypothetical protein
VAHGIWFDDDEIRRLGAAGTGVAHCPSSNARLAAGMCRVTDLRAAGAPLGLGVDGVASNEIGGLFPEQTPAHVNRCGRPAFVSLGKFAEVQKRQLSVQFPQALTFPPHATPARTTSARSGVAPVMSSTPWLQPETPNQRLSAPM